MLRLPAASLGYNILGDVHRPGGTRETERPKGIKAWVATCTAIHTQRTAQTRAAGPIARPGWPHTPVGTVGANETTQGHWDLDFTPGDSLL